MNKKRFFIGLVKALAAGLAAAILLFLYAIVALDAVFGSANGGLYSLLFLIIAVLAEFAVIAALWGFIKKKTVYIPVCGVILICVMIYAGFYVHESYQENIPTVSESENLLLSYLPYDENTKTVTLGEESSLKLEENVPVMDGATALYPVYSGFAKAVYPKELIYGFKSDFLKCTTTTQAYTNIVTGDADIIFAASPSEEQKRFAAENGVELVYTPIGREAFVFFVNSKNPLKDISPEDIQRIYSGEITEWKELGVKRLGDIKAFQRDEGSGSQSALEKLMAGKTLMTPPEEDVIDGMGGIIHKTADYKNFRNAIGFSFRFYATEMVKDDKIKLLSVNGVYPDIESIENGTYPLASYFYAVTRSDADENVLKLLEWIKGEQGQRIIEMTGYTPLEK